MSEENNISAPFYLKSYTSDSYYSFLDILNTTLSQHIRCNFYISKCQNNYKIYYNGITLDNLYNFLNDGLQVLGNCMLEKNDDGQLLIVYQNMNGGPIMYGSENTRPSISIGRECRKWNLQEFKNLSLPLISQLNINLKNTFINKNFLIIESVNVPCGNKKCKCIDFKFKPNCLLSYLSELE